MIDPLINNEIIIVLASRAISALVTFLLFAVVGYLAEALITRIHRHASDEQRVLIFIGHIAKYVIMLGGAIVALSLMGISPVALTTGVGAAAVVLGIALKDYLADVFSGLFIVFNHVLSVGNHITVDGVSGTVQSITLRTTILTAEGSRIIVPNSVVAKSSVIIHNI